MNPNLGRLLLFAIFIVTLERIKTPKHADKHEDSFQICFAELEAHPKGPQLIMGDFNASITTIPTLHKFVNATDEDGHNIWYDIGRHAAQWGQPPHEGTCKAPNSNTRTRRDYVGANDQAYQSITEFKVEHHQPWPVHSKLTLELDVEVANEPYLQCKLQQSFYEAFIERIRVVQKLRNTITFPKGFLRKLLKSCKQ